MKNLSISVVIPVFNCERTIGAVLDCLFAAIPADIPLEVVIVDDASTDDTVKVCQRYPVNLIQLQQNRGPAFCRNHAVQQSQHNFLLFLDSDIEFEPDLITKMCNYIKDSPELAGIFTFTSPIPINKSFISRYFALQEYLRFLDAFENGHSSWSFISTRCGLLKRNVFKETGGFNENFFAAAFEDLEFSCRMDDCHQLALRPDCLVRHYWPQTLLKMLKRLHVNARGVMSFPKPMRKKASIPFLKDRNARLLVAISWVLVFFALIWWPLLIPGLILHLCAIQQAYWLLRGCFKYENMFFTIKAWGIYNLTVIPFITGVVLGILDKCRMR